MNISTEFYATHFSSVFIGLGAGECEHTISFAIFLFSVPAQVTFMEAMSPQQTNSE